MYSSDVGESRELKGVASRGSIRYEGLEPLPDTTSIFLIDNKAKDIAYLNGKPGTNHSNFQTNIIQQQDLDPDLSSVRSITLDERSHWVGDVKNYLKSSCVNVTDFYKSSKIKCTVKVDVDTFQEVEITIPEGNYTITEVIDFLNYELFQVYTQTLRKTTAESFANFGVKFDTRNMSLGVEIDSNLIYSGQYTYRGFHPDIYLLPGCSVDFSTSRISNILGIRKRNTYEEGFIVTYDDLEGGEIPALLDKPAFDADNTVIRPILQDADGVSYNVEEYEPDKWRTKYRSWVLAYGVRGSVCNTKYLLVAPDVTGGVTQLYHSFPEMFKCPTTFLFNMREDKLPIHYTSFLPFESKEIYNPSAVWSQQLQAISQRAANVFNRMPKNEIMIQPPALSVTSVGVNRLISSDYKNLPLMNKLKGNQSVVVTDDEKRYVPYIVKNLSVVHPHVSSARYL